MGPGGRVLVDPVRDAPDPGVEAGLAQSEEAGQVPLGRAGHSRHCQGAVVYVLTGCYLYRPPPPLVGTLSVWGLEDRAV